MAETTRMCDPAVDQGVFTLVMRRADGLPWGGTTGERNYVEVHSQGMMRRFTKFFPGNEDSVVEISVPDGTTLSWVFRHTSPETPQMFFPGEFEIWQHGATGPKEVFRTRTILTNVRFSHTCAAACNDAPTYAGGQALSDLAVAGCVEDEGVCRLLFRLRDAGRRGWVSAGNQSERALLVTKSVPGQDDDVFELTPTRPDVPGEGPEFTMYEVELPDVVEEVSGVLVPSRISWRYLDRDDPEALDEHGVEVFLVGQTRALPVQLVPDVSVERPEGFFQCTEGSGCNDFPVQRGEPESGQSLEELLQAAAAASVAITQTGAPTGSTLDAGRPPRARYEPQAAAVEPSSMPTVIAGIVGAVVVVLAAVSGVLMGLRCA
jgi:hypothetical protein